MNFLLATSRTSRKDIYQKILSLCIQLKNDNTLSDIAQMFNSKLQGWFNYYGKFYPSELDFIWKKVNEYLVRSVRRKYRRFAEHKHLSKEYLNKIARENPNLLVNWKLEIFPDAQIMRAG